MMTTILLVLISVMILLLGWDVMQKPKQPTTAHNSGTAATAVPGEQEQAGEEANSKTIVKKPVI